MEIPIPKAFFNISSRVTSKGGSPLEALSLSLFRVRCSIPRAPFILLSKSPVDKPSNRFPRGPLWGEMPVSRSFSTYPPGSPAREPFPQIPFTELPQRERHCTYRAPFNHLPNFPVKEPTLGCLSHMKVVPYPHSLPFINFRAPSKLAPTPGSPNRAPIEIDLP